MSSGAVLSASCEFSLDESNLDISEHAVASLDDSENGSAAPLDESFRKEDTTSFTTLMPPPRATDEGDCSTKGAVTTKQQEDVNEQEALRGANDNHGNLRIQQLPSPSHGPSSEFSTSDENKDDKKEKEADCSPAEYPGAVSVSVPPPREIHGGQSGRRLLDTSSRCLHQVLADDLDDDTGVPTRPQRAPSTAALLQPQGSKTTYVAQEIDTTTRRAVDDNTTLSSSPRAALANQRQFRPSRRRLAAATTTTTSRPATTTTTTTTTRSTTAGDKDSQQSSSVDKNNIVDAIVKQQDNLKSSSQRHLRPSRRRLAAANAETTTFGETNKPSSSTGALQPGAVDATTDEFEDLAAMKEADDIAKVIALQEQRQQQSASRVGAIPVRGPNQRESRNTTTTTRQVRAARSIAAPPPPTPSVMTIEATPVRGSIHLSSEHREELERLRSLVENAVEAEHVQPAVDEAEDDLFTSSLRSNSIRSNSTPPYQQPRSFTAPNHRIKKVVESEEPLTKSLHAAEGIGDTSFRVSERNTTIQVTRKKRTKWYQACCGNHNVILESVVVMEDVSSGQQQNKSYHGPGTFGGD